MLSAWNCGSGKGSALPCPPSPLPGKADSSLGSKAEKGSAVPFPGKAASAWPRWTEGQMYRVQGHFQGAELRQQVETVASLKKEDMLPATEEERVASEWSWSPQSQP